jgi:hypothetical protein
MTYVDIFSKIWVLIFKQLIPVVYNQIIKTQTHTVNKELCRHRLLTGFGYVLSADGQPVAETGYQTMAI